MKRLEKLHRANEYLKGFRLNGSGIVPLRVVSQADATGRLSRLSGDQILIARPELHQSGDSDRHRDSISLAFFVLSKDLGPASSPEAEDELFGRLETIASDVLTKLAYDTTACGLLAGLSLTSADVVPENTVFGGWVGYSLDITLE